MSHEQHAHGGTGTTEARLDGIEARLNTIGQRIGSDSTLGILGLLGRHEVLLAVIARQVEAVHRALGLETGADGEPLTPFPGTGEAMTAPGRPEEYLNVPLTAEQAVTGLARLGYNTDQATCAVACAIRDGQYALPDHVVIASADRKTFDIRVPVITREIPVRRRDPDVTRDLLRSGPLPPDLVARLRAAGTPPLTQDQALDYLTRALVPPYPQREAVSAVSGAPACEDGIYRFLARHDVAYVVSGGVHQGYVVTPKASDPAVRTADDEEAAIAMVRAAGYAGSSAQHAVSQARQDGSCTLRSRRLGHAEVTGHVLCKTPDGFMLRPAAPGDDDGDRSGSGRAGLEELAGSRPASWPDLSRDYDVGEILAAVEIADRWLDEAAPEIYRGDHPASKLANHWRRIAAGPASEGIEAVDALNLATGGNPRKGVAGDESTILGELGDGAVANLLAIQSFTKDTGDTWDVFITALAKILGRVPRKTGEPS